MISLKKEHIKDRMIRLAARQWNISENEIDSNFDPLVTLILDAMSAELEAVGNQIKEIQSGLLDEFATLMMPLEMLHAQPAHCIITAMPNDAEIVINKENGFAANVQSKKANQMDYEEVAVNFMPIGDIKLIKTNIKYLRIGKNYNEIIDTKKKVLVEGDKSGQSNVIHFALDNLSGIRNLTGLQIYFDLKGHSDASSFYSAIHAGSVYIDSNELEWRKGYYYDQQFNSELQDIVSNGFNYVDKARKSVANIYQPQFMSITNGAFAKNAAAGDEFWENISEDIKKKAAAQPLLYGKIVLKRPFPVEVLERVQIGVNAFPVINYEEEKVNFKTNKWLNIIALPVKTSFLSLKSIESLEGNVFKYRISKSDTDISDGEAILRTFRVGSNSSKEVRKTIQNLLENIRDESAYFHMVSNDFIAERLKEVSRILTRLDDQLYVSNDVKPTNYYVLLKPQRIDSTVEVRYLITDTKNAMHLKSGNSLRAYKHTLTHPAQTFALTNSFGSVDHLSDYAARQYLLRQLTSRGKIISVEDIRHLCRQMLGENAVNITVERKTKVLQGTKHGLERFVNISITVKSGEYSAEELYYYEQQILDELRKDSAFVYPFEIEFQEV